MFIYLVLINCWIYPIESDLYSNITIGQNGRICVSSDKGNLYTLNSEGSLEWCYKTSHGIYFPPAICADGTILIGTDNGYLYALNHQGKIIWWRNIGLRITSPIVLGQNALYVISDYRRLYCINLDGTINWTQEVVGWINNSPAVGMDGRVYMAADEGIILAFNPLGNLEWEDSLDSKIATAPVVGFNNAVYVGTDDGILYALGPKGRILWHARVDDARISALILGSNGWVYVCQDNGYLYSFSSDGKLQFKVYTGFWPGHNPIVEPARIIYGRPPIIYVLKQDGTFVDFISIYIPDEILSLKVNGDRYYAVSVHYLYAFDTSDTYVLPAPDSVSTPIASNKADNEFRKPQINVLGSDISYKLPESDRVSLKIYDGLGRLVYNSFKGEYSAGFHRLSLNTLGLPRGLFFLLLETTGYHITAKLIILK